jgi:hypothetical protein
MLNKGQTRYLAGPRSEGISYWLVSDALNWFGYNIRSRAITEDFSTDSFQNVLFSICRFKQFTGMLLLNIGNYPKRITVAGWEFKRKRFTELHRASLKYPTDSFFYKSNDNYSPALEHLDGEKETYQLFLNDMYGCKEVLMNKKISRNPFMIDHGYEKACPELNPIFNACENITDNHVLNFDPPWN